MTLSVCAVIPLCGASSAEKPPWAAWRRRCEMEGIPGEAYVAQYAFRAADYARSLDIRHVGLALRHAHSGDQEKPHPARSDAKQRGFQRSNPAADAMEGGQLQSPS